MRDYLINPRKATTFSLHFPTFSPAFWRGLKDDIYTTVLELFASQRQLRSTSLIKLKRVIDDVLKYIFRRSVDGVIALPKEVFLRASAHGGSMRTLLNYKTIRQAFEKVGLIKSLGLQTYKGGPCQHYHVSLGGDMKIKRSDEFVGRTPSRSAVCEYDKYSVNILGDDVLVRGDEVTAFAKAYEKKVRDYHSNPFIKILRDGRLLKGATVSYYIQGAAICLKYGYDVRRFIESQFFFYHQWQDKAPDIKYVTSVYSMWNAIGRYENYCVRFRDSLDYFGEGKDNIEEASQRSRKKAVPAYGIKEAINISQQDYYRIKDAFKIPDRKLFLLYGHPLKPSLSLHFLMENATWLTLLKEQAWGNEVDSKFWAFIAQVDLNTLR